MTTTQRCTNRAPAWVNQFNKKIMRNSRQILEGLGLTQAMSYGLTTVAKSQNFLKQTTEPVKVAWPMTLDHEALRMNLVSGLLDDAAYNHARFVDDGAGEQGKRSWPG